MADLFISYGWQTPDHKYSGFGNCSLGYRAKWDLDEIQDIYDIEKHIKEDIEKRNNIEVNISVTNWRWLNNKKTDPTATTSKIKVSKSMGDI